MRKTIAFILALLGLFDSIYLLWMYLSPSIPMVCLGGGCDAVRASKYAHVFGVSTPIYGVVFYALLVALMFADAMGVSPGYAQRKGGAVPISTPDRLILGLSAIGFVVSSALTYVEAAVVHAWCAWCVTQAICATAIFVIYLTGFRNPAFTHEKRVTGRYWNVLMVAIAAGCASFYFLQRAELKQAQAPPPPSAANIAERVIRPDSHVYLNTNSPVTFVEFGDLQCPACAAVYPEVESLRAQYGDRVKFVFRHFPFPTIHPFAMHAAEASECAAQQGKFWEFVDRAYQSHEQLADPDLERYAGEIGLNTQEFHQCLATDATLPIVQRDTADGMALGVRATPTFFIGNRKIEGALSEYAFSALLAEDLEKERPASPAPASAAAPPAPASKRDPKAASKSTAKNSAPGISLSGTGSSNGFLTIKGASTDCSEDAAKGPQPTVIHTNDAEKKLAQGATFVDVRPAAEYRAAHIKGALNVPLLEIEQRAGELPKQKQIVLYEAGTAAAGDVCAAAKSAARVLMSRGFNAVVYQEGLKEWEKSGGPVDK